MSICLIYWLTMPLQWKSGYPDRGGGGWEHQTVYGEQLDNCITVRTTSVISVKKRTKTRSTLQWQWMEDFFVLWSKISLFICRKTIKSDTKWKLKPPEMILGHFWTSAEAAKKTFRERTPNYYRAFTLCVMHVHHKVRQKVSLIIVQINKDKIAWKRALLQISLILLNINRFTDYYFGIAIPYNRPGLNVNECSSVHYLELESANRSRSRYR